MKLSGVGVSRCDQCGRRRAGITVFQGRDLCPACLPPLRPSATADRQVDPTHRDPLLGIAPIYNVPREVGSTRPIAPTLESRGWGRNT